ncbi:MAG TPA: PPC domain-containing DNA-binding protein [Terriglobales bacterium]|nr:PPC domain-containing DNA-binding protein [Terriglobales bacterium]
MYKLLFSALLLVSTLCTAQETRREVTHSSGNPALDAKPNSDKVPDAIVFNTSFKRVVILRFKFGTDLLAGLQKMVQQEKIHNAVILSAVGSVRNYQVHQVGNRDMPPEDVFVKNSTAPADIIGMSGVVINGRVHPHITLANADKAFGGHLEPDTTVFTFAIVTLGVLDDNLDLSKVDDWNYR